MRVFEILLAIPAASACVERSSSALRYIMSEPRLNVLILVYAHRYIKLDYEKIVDFFAIKQSMNNAPDIAWRNRVKVHQQLSSCSFKKLVTKNSPDET